MRVKFGPTVAQFRGEARLAYDHAARRCTIEGRGIDGRGASRANASGVVRPRGTDTTVLKVEGNFNVTGPLETFANAGGVHLARALLAEFAEQHGAKLTAERGSTPTAPATEAAPPTGRLSCAAIERCSAVVAGVLGWLRADLFGKGDNTMSDNQVSDVLAQAFAAEGVDTLFTLMGDANMYWSAAMADNQKARLIHARHEHCAVAMADGYARATGKVGVASVTCGPGYTQIMTALIMAARGNAPVVVFAGDAPIGASWYLQSIDQAPLALATGAHFVPIRTIDRALDCVREAFYVARAERRPVVLSVPLDLQKEEFPYLPDYTPSTDLMPRPQMLRPDPAVVDEIVAMIAEAERPIVIGGRGATLVGRQSRARSARRGIRRAAGDDPARQRACSTATRSRSTSPARSPPISAANISPKATW